MNLLKNLMILAVLGALGYGIYVSLSPNNTESRSSADAPTAESPSPKLSSAPGGPLALGGGSSSETSGLGVAALSAPPLSGDAPKGSLAATSSLPATPYTASGTSTVMLPPAPPPLPSKSATAALAPPALPAAAANVTPPNGVAPPPVAVPALPAANQSSAATAVCNLSPPPQAATADKVTDDLLQRQFADVMAAVRKRLDAGNLAEAQLALTTLYLIPNLPAEKATQITELLDQLAGSVIYSRQSYLESPYVVHPGDTIERIAQTYQVPWQLLARINGLIPPGTPSSDETVKDQPLPPGKALKVVRGPFDAMVSLDKRQLTLMVHNRYAGRFSIGIGRDQPKLEGQYTVGEKKLSPAYYGPDGTTMNPNDPKNPLGNAWIGLTDRIGIHGAADPQSIGRDDNRGTICVGDRDLQDLYGILSVGSRVTIVR